ncbi:hypothetical protein HKX42_00140 [Salinisphaera sp. USBA-960]|nr:hypothetical protein [Salifodinibacter halophilus]NNC25300.1 hypothetical protein [Salifodinibacter halophilus]
MYGFPKHIATRNDVDLLMNYLNTDWATSDHKARGVNMLQGLIDSQQAYFFDRVLADNESPDGSAPAYIVLTDDDSGQRRQLKLQSDSGALIHQIGLTEADAQDMITQIQEAQ